MPVQKMTSKMKMLSIIQLHCTWAIHMGDDDARIVRVKNFVCVFGFFSFVLFSLQNISKHRFRCQTISSPAETLFMSLLNGYFETFLLVNKLSEGMKIQKRKFVGKINKNKTIRKYNVRFTWFAIYDTKENLKKNVFFVKKSFFYNRTKSDNCANQPRIGSNHIISNIGFRW